MNLTQTRSQDLKRTNWLSAAVARVLVASVFLATSVPAVAAPGMEFGKERHKVKDIHELDESAPHDISGKVQFIPTAKAGAHLKAQKQEELRAAREDRQTQKSPGAAEKREARKAKAAAKREARKTKMAAKRQTRLAKKTSHAGKRAHVARAKHGAVRAHLAHKHHPGRKHKNRLSGARK
jgi:hypothetical protein